MSELNQKEVNDQMYLFVKRWLDDLPFEESKKIPVMAIGYCLARLSKQDELLKEQDELLKHEYWRGYNNGRADERGLQEGTIMQTFSPD